MLSMDEVIVMAFPIWFDNPAHMHGPDLYEDEDVLRPTDVDAALCMFEDSNPDPLFWDTVDRTGMRSRFIDYINWQLGHSGLSYEAVMKERRSRLAQAT